MVPLVVLSQFCFCHCFLCLLPPGSCRLKKRLILFLYFFSRVWSCFVLEPLWFSFETVMPTCFLKPLEFWRFCRHFCLKDLRSGMCLLDTLNGFFMAWIYRRSLEDTKSTASDLLNQLNLFLVPHTGSKKLVCWCANPTEISEGMHLNSGRLNQYCCRL